MLLSHVPHEYEVKSKRSPIPPKIESTSIVWGRWGTNPSGDTWIRFLHEHKYITASTRIYQDQRSPLHYSNEENQYPSIVWSLSSRKDI